MTWDRTATIRLGVSAELHPPRVQWGPLRRTDMGYTTWPGMCLSGVGIGMGHRMVNRQRLIQPVRQQVRTACSAAAVGATTRPPPGRRTAAKPTRRMRTTPSGSEPFWPRNKSCHDNECNQTQTATGVCLPPTKRPARTAASVSGLCWPHNEKEQNHAPEWAKTKPPAPRNYPAETLRAMIVTKELVIVSHIVEVH